jgi:hypothetical protein
VNKAFKPLTGGNTMKFDWRKLLIVSVCCVAAAMVAGCGVSAKKLNAAEQRIATLQQKGVSDSLLTGARVLLVQARTAKQLGNGIGAKTQYDSLEKLLMKAETSYGTTTEQFKPGVEAMRKSIADRKLTLSGTHLKEADSLLAILDASIGRNDWQQAKDLAAMINMVINSLVKNELTAKGMKPKVIGTWSSTEVIKNKEEKSNAVEKKSFTFGADGKVDIVEERNGQTNEALKEDWKFESWGTWSLKGDTILMSITREKCGKQIYQNLKVKAGKKEWVKFEKPPYDSTITNGKKDRYMAFDYLKETLKKR